MTASILAADNSPSIRQLVRFTLKAAGYDVVEASDGVEALGIARTRPVSLVIADVNLPRLDGMSLIRELRALPSYRFTPLLMLSAESGVAESQRDAAVPASAWIVKPIQAEQLLSAVKRVLS
jgi:two-component system chemotaxis response regulator CheY